MKKNIISILMTAIITFILSSIFILKLSSIAYTKASKSANVMALEINAGKILKNLNVNNADKPKYEAVYLGFSFKHENNYLIHLFEIKPIAPANVELKSMNNGTNIYTSYSLWSALLN